MTTAKHETHAAPAAAEKKSARAVGDNPASFPDALPVEDISHIVQYLRGQSGEPLEHVLFHAWVVLGWLMGKVVPFLPRPTPAPMMTVARAGIADELQKLLDDPDPWARPDGMKAAAGTLAPWLVPVVSALVTELLKKLLGG
jgi:hypothetical protein